jgi:hypothetical protein
MFSLSDEETEMEKDGVGLVGEDETETGGGWSRYLILIVVGVLSERGAASIRLLRHKRYIFPSFALASSRKLKIYTNNVI